MRAWAEWFAIISGAIYLPVEIIGLIKRATFLKAGVFLVNAGVVGYLVYVLWMSKKANAENECGPSAGV